MPILFFVNCERTVLFSVKRDLDPLYHPHTSAGSMLKFVHEAMFEILFTFPGPEVGRKLVTPIQIRQILFNLNSNT